MTVAGRPFAFSSLCCLRAVTHHPAGEVAEAGTIAASDGDDRTEAELEAAVRAQDKLIAEAQRLLKAFVESNRVHPDAVINDLLWLLDGPRQREAQRLVREAWGDDPGNVG